MEMQVREKCEFCENGLIQNPQWQEFYKTYGEEELRKRLDKGRDYLMTVKPSELTVEDALEAFGYDRNGIKAEKTMGERSGGMVKTKYKYIKFDYQPYGKWLITNHRYNEHIGLISYVKKWKEWELVPFEDTGWTIECLEDVIHFIKQLNSQKQETHQ